MSTEKKPRRSRDFSQMQTRLKDTISACSFYMPTSEEFTAKVMGIRKDFNLPSYWWSWASGYVDRVRDEWYRDRFIYCVCFEPGVPTVMEWNKLTEAQRDVLRDTKNPANRKIMKGHFWTDRDGNLTEKMWGGSTDEESDQLYEEIKARRAEKEKGTP